MKNKEKLRIARTALESVERALQGLTMLLRNGHKVSAIVSLEHMQKRCKQILKDIE